jgi:hypothetical protein
MNCNECGQNFEYFLGEKESYAKFNFVLPLNCAECRQLRRLAFRNEKSLYHNKSFLSGKQIIALYPKESPFRIIDQGEWWNDNFDATIYGREFDFNRPFFEQFLELQKEVPRWSRIALTCENSDFTNNCAETKNSYLSFSSHSSENLYYCLRVYRSNDCIDCINVKNGHYSSNCTDCADIHNVHFSQLAENCSDSYFLIDCKSCNNCILCANLRNKSYMILNQQYSKEEFEKAKEIFIKQLIASPKSFVSQFEEFKKDKIRRGLNNNNCENVEGNFINGSRNIYNGFFVTSCEDSINIYNCDETKSSYDTAYNDKSELSLECDTAFGLYDCCFCSYTVNSKSCRYCDQCFYINNCFGCIGLKRGKNIILNKQYSEEEYKDLVSKINEHMKRTGEFGRPFPSHLSSFSYNDTMAYDSAPLTKEQALSRGFTWHEEEKETNYYAKQYKIPETEEEMDTSICDKILICEKSGKNYKIIPQEFEFYKKLRLPFPRLCPDQRYKELLKLQTPRKLLNTKCSICGKDIKTTYPEASGYQISCEDCYLKTVY